MDAPIVFFSFFLSSDRQAKGNFKKKKKLIWSFAISFCETLCGYWCDSLWPTKASRDRPTGARKTSGIFWMTKMSSGEVSISCLFLDQGNKSFWHLIIHIFRTQAIFCLWSTFCTLHVYFMCIYITIYITCLELTPCNKIFFCHQWHTSRLSMFQEKYMIYWPYFYWPYGARCPNTALSWCQWPLEETILTVFILKRSMV